MCKRQGVPQIFTHTIISPNTTGMLTDHSYEPLFTSSAADAYMDAEAEIQENIELEVRFCLDAPPPIPTTHH